jgi:hypothetical protein
LRTSLPQEIHNAQIHKPFQQIRDLNLQMIASFIHCLLATLSHTMLAAHSKSLQSWKSLNDLVPHQGDFLLCLLEAAANRDNMKSGTA